MGVIVRFHGRRLAIITHGGLPCGPSQGDRAGPTSGIGVLAGGGARYHACKKTRNNRQLEEGLQDAVEGEKWLNKAEDCSKLNARFSHLPWSRDGVEMSIYGTVHVKRPIETQTIRPSAI